MLLYQYYVVRVERPLTVHTSPRAASPSPLTSFFVRVQTRWHRKQHTTRGRVESRHAIFILQTSVVQSVVHARTKGAENTVLGSKIRSIDFSS